LIRLEDLNPTEFLAALKSYAQRNSTLTIIAICPPSEETLLIQRLEAMIVEQASLFTEVSVLQCGSNGTRQINDASAYNLGHIPYTREFFTELGTMIARKIFSASLSSYKVIVMDCDETLWGGDCGKDGPDGVRIGFPYQALQELMVQQQASGMLLCLCSKNNEADVFEVFRCHPDMPLKLEHFTFCRLGGESTTENLKYLAQELRLSSERFIYLSRNPVECEQVHTLCPEVLSLCLPSDPSEIPSFLNHLWVFPHSSKSADIFVTV
jgi:HAD superfamily phosphatase (TIGR01681 family)